MKGLTRSAWPIGIATAAALIAAAVAIGSTSRGAAAPENSSLPTITGDSNVGGKLTANPGTWNGTTPIEFQYQWLVCGTKGEACSNISGATKKNFTVREQDLGNTIRVKVIAGNSQGSANATSDATKLVGAATAPPPSSTGCPSGKGNISVKDMSLPARLLIDTVGSSPSTLGRDTQTVTVTVHVKNTCGQTVAGALVYVTATPYNQFVIPPEASTDGNGDAVLHMGRLSGYPVSSKQGLLALFVRARKDGEDILAGVSVRRLVSVNVNLNS